MGLTGIVDILGLGLDAVGGFAQLNEAERRRQNPPEVGRQTGRNDAVTSFQGGDVPRGGFQLSPFLQGQINSLEAPQETVKGGLFNLFDVPNPEFQAFSDSIQRAQQIVGSDTITETQAQQLQQILRDTGKDELAGEIGFQLTQQTGGFNVDPGVRDVLQAGINDTQTARDITERDQIRQLRSLGITQGIRTELLPKLRGELNNGFLSARRDQGIAENRAIGALRAGALPAIAPVIQAQRLRDEINGRLEDTSVARLESQRVALDRRHDNQLNSARVQLEQQFPGNPGLVESQLNQIRSSQFQEIGTLQNGLIADFARLESDIDVQTAGFVQQSTVAAAGQLVDLSRLESQARDIFSARRNQINLAKISSDMSISMLDRDNRAQEAQLLRSWNEILVPEQELVNQIFSLNTSLEDRRVAFQQGTFQQGQAGLNQLSVAVSNFQARKDAEKAADAASESNSSFGGLGSAAGTALGAVLAAPTGGLSIAAGASLGGSIGGGIGSSFKS